jgi:hypothetical protein
MSVKDCIILHIREANTSAETWKMLKALYVNSNKNRILFPKTKLLGIMMDVNESLVHFWVTLKR